MKKTMLMFLLLLMSISSAEDIDRIAQNILKKREGPGYRIEGIGNPFVVIKREENSSVPVVVEKVKEPTFFFGGIINDYVSINGRWIRNGETTEGMKVEILDSHHVKLSNGKRTIVLPKDETSAPWLKIEE